MKRFSFYIYYCPPRSLFVLSADCATATTKTTTTTTTTAAETRTQNIDNRRCDLSIPVKGRPIFPLRFVGTKQTRRQPIGQLNRIGNFTQVAVVVVAVQ